MGKFDKKLNPALLFAKRTQTLKCCTDRYFKIILFKILGIVI